MKATKESTLRRIFIIVILLVFTSIDVYVNSEHGFKLGMLSYVAGFVFLHALAFEAVITKSKILIWAMWLFVVIISMAAFVLIEEWYAGPTVFVFLIVYFAILILYLKKELLEKKVSE